MVFCRIVPDKIVIKEIHDVPVPTATEETPSASAPTGLAEKRMIAIPFLVQIEVHVKQSFVYCFFWIRPLTDRHHLGIFLTDSPQDITPDLSGSLTFKIILHQGTCHIDPEAITSLASQNLITSFIAVRVAMQAASV